MNLDACLEAIRTDAARLAATAEVGDLAAPVTGCPGWSLRDLLVHTGFVHRWATHAIQHAGPAAPSDVRTPDADADGEELGAWIRLGAGVLADVLATTPLDADTWHPFPAEQKAWVWSRRQAMETMMHRWDAEVACSGTSRLDAEHARTGLDEFFEMLRPRALLREGRPAPDVRLHVRCTDRARADRGDVGEWTVWGDDGDYRMTTGPDDEDSEDGEGGKDGDAFLQGSAEALLLAVMGRTDGSALESSGDPAALSAWLDLPGL